MSTVLNNRVTPSDEGIYTCVVEPETLFNSSKEISVTVQSMLNLYDLDHDNL